MTTIDDLHEEGKLRERMADILTRTANALKGDPVVTAEALGVAGMMHSWHDLPEAAERMKGEVNRLQALVNAQNRRIQALSELIARHGSD